MDIEQVVRNTPATISVTFYEDEVPTDSAGPVTVTITRNDGTVFDTTSASSAGVGTGTYSYSLAPQSMLDTLAFQWSGTFNGQTSGITSYAEIVGGQYFTIAELRGSDSALLNPKFTTAKLREARRTTEAEFERICRRAFVPRVCRELLTGDGTTQLWLSHPQPLSIVKLIVSDVDVTSTWVVRADRENLRTLLTRNGMIWPAAYSPANTIGGLQDNIDITYEYGMKFVPADIFHAALTFAKYTVLGDASRIDERANVMTIPDFGAFTLATPGQRGSYTGIPSVDVVLDDYILEGAS